MKIYSVGGCVRDIIMGETPNDIDYVVVGATNSDMISLGFNQVGKDFPVYIGVDGNEYALARKERKVGAGYVGFEFDTDGVSLKEDTYRRDLTINSIAMDDEGNIIDFHNGRDDINNKILRHVSNAFMEDPVRVLRIARFMSRFGPEWKIAEETRDMIIHMCKKGMLDELQKDRVWKEMYRALGEPYPSLFFRALHYCDCLHVIFPEIYKLLTATKSMKWHPEGNAFEHTMLVVEQAAIHEYDADIVFCALVHDIGKGLTPFEKLPRHYGHDVEGAKFLDIFCEKYKVPSHLKKMSKYVTRFHMYMHKLHDLNPKTIVKMFEECRADVCMVDALYKIGICDERGRLGKENSPIDQLEILLKYADAYKSVKFSNFPSLVGETDGEKIKNVLTDARIKKIGEVKKSA